ncbi:hypothetical protein IFR04_001697 [Cadophora malorum]|uniref:Uncharacterized protein n=1 Tax=Cadophora malorum TaxID=108018 RepID=A0A8H7WHS9_9HELO|nr:hypothetical protein IFR04_001697 [Cadophora malorum]
MIQALRDGQGLQKDVPDYSTMQEEEFEDDEDSLIYSVRNSPTRSDAGKHEGVEIQGKSSFGTSKEQLTVALYETAPEINANMSKKKQAAARLLKSSIQHAFLKMQHLRRAVHDPTSANLQALSDNGEELKKVKHELLQAVDHFLLLV